MPFEWDDHNEPRLLLQHNVSALEAEQCFSNPHSIRKAGSDYLLLGRTDWDRLLLIVFERKTGALIRIYSAREMTLKERRVYRRLVGAAVG